MDQATETLPDQHGRTANPSARSAPSPSYGDLVGTIQYLLEERTRLEQRLFFAERTVKELSQQAQYANTLARNAQQPAATATTAPCMDKKDQRAKALARGKPSTWIGGSWLAPSEPILAPAEKLWQAGNAQGALVATSALLLQHNLTMSEDVHTHLFTSAILRAVGDPAQASKYAEDALVIAKEADSYMLASKCELYRGLCFVQQQRYAQAQWCFVLASYLEGYQDLLEPNREFAEKMCLQTSDAKDPGRRLDLRSI
ncbi:MAG: hypothetical protein LQ346_000925 [Caloplaca aetnensis]|nr:MAG: hypothetical protein LQ346_000925 [Caloplaca aetnensis]